MDAVGEDVTGPAAGDDVSGWTYPLAGAAAARGTVDAGHARGKVVILL